MTHQRLHCGEARRERTEEEYTRSHITAVRGPPDKFKRFFQVQWEGVNDTGRIYRGKHAGNDTMPGEPWQPTWEPMRFIVDEDQQLIDEFFAANPNLDPAADAGQARRDGASGDGAARPAWGVARQLPAASGATIWPLYT